MKIVADESVDGPVVGRLRLDGHAVIYVAELDAGIDDPSVLSFSHQETALLITADKDFGELVFQKRLPHSGVLLIRLAGLTPDEKLDLVSAAIHEHGHEMLRQFSVLSRRALRIVTRKA